MADVRGRVMTTAISVDKFSELVDVIYAAALDPSAWTAFARLLTEVTDSVLAGIGIFDISSNRFVQTYGYGIPAGYFERYDAVAQFNPLLPYAALGAPGELIVNSSVIPEDEFVNSRFHREFSGPLGLRDSMSVICLRSGTRVALVVANRAVDKPLYTAADGELLQLLSPHICRAMTISDAFDLCTVTSEALQSTLDRLAAGVFLVDGHGRVVHLNQAAERMAQRGDILSVRDQRLWPTHAASRAELAAALNRASPNHGAEPGMPTTADGPMVALHPSDSAGPGMIATLLPLKSGSQISGGPLNRARWAVFVQDPQVALPLPGEAFGKLYKLTPAELRVALALAPGLTPEAAADTLGLGLPTVRTHLQRIFAKTGTNRHGDFVRLMLATMPPITRPDPV
jgi:DNA-binding CsgD family transcriptional regulator/PAS domain-containing protein